MSTTTNLRATRRCFAIMLLLATAPTLPAQSSSVYHITHTYTLGGGGSWDYIIPDPPKHRLFIGGRTAS